jgi:hypothetical protein
MFSSEVDSGSLSALMIANRLMLAGAFAGTVQSKATIRVPP